MDTRRVVRLGIPAEDELPVFGGGCCAVAPEDAIRSELDSWPGVRTLAVDLARQSVAMELGPGAPPIGDLIDALRGLDIEVQQERTLDDDSPVLSQREEGSDAAGTRVRSNGGGPP